MGRKSALTVVSDGHHPAVEPPKTVRAAVDVSERALLVTLRNKIASDIDTGVPPHTLAPLSRQLRELDKEIRLIDNAEKSDDVGNAASTPDEDWVAG